MLTPRLEMILMNIYTRTIADIGTDHAYIPISLARNNKIDYAIATDLRKGPLMIAKGNIEKYNLSDKIELRLGGGISVIEENEAESIIIAGMGGELITTILSDDEKKIRSAKYLILQPMNSQDVLRKWLSENNFSIIKEDISIEGHKVYNLIIAKNGVPYNFENEFSLHIPPYLLDHKYFYALKDKKKREFTKIKDGLIKSSTKDENLIKKYTDFLKELESI